MKVLTFWNIIWLIHKRAIRTGIEVILNHSPYSFVKQRTTKSCNVVNDNIKVFILWQTKCALYQHGNVFQMCFVVFHANILCILTFNIFAFKPTKHIFLCLKKWILLVFNRWNVGFNSCSVGFNACGVVGILFSD